MDVECGGGRNGLQKKKHKTRKKKLLCSSFISFSRINNGHFLMPHNMFCCCRCYFHLIQVAFPIYRAWNIWKMWCLTREENYNPISNIQRSGHDKIKREKSDSSRGKFLYFKKNQISFDCNMFNFCWKGSGRSFCVWVDVQFKKIIRDIG